MTSQVERYSRAAIIARDAKWIHCLENPNGMIDDELISAHVRRAIRAAVAEAVAREREGIIVLLREILAEGIHTAFRRGGGGPASNIWEIITKMDDAEWGGVVFWLADGLAAAIRSRGEGKNGLYNSDR